MTPSDRLLYLAESREGRARQTAQLVDSLRHELEHETSPAARVALECQIRVGKADIENYAAAARLYREAAEEALGLE